MNSIPTTEPPIAALEYASPRMAKPVKYNYRRLILLSAAPMVLGGVALGICWGMRWRWGPDYTAFMVLISIFLLSVGAVELWLFVRRERGLGRLTPVGLGVRATVAGLLLVLNVPVVMFYGNAPRFLTRKTTVTVINNGPAVVDRLVVKNAGVNRDIGPVFLGETVKADFDVPMGQWLSYDVWQTRGNSRSMSGGTLPAGRGEHTITITNAGLSVK